MDSETRDKSQGAQFVSIFDFVTFIKKYIIEYSNKGKLEDSVNFFDMDNDGKINPKELESMLNAFGQTEKYLEEDDI